MSVIGRLDEQVDAVLISPLSKKRPPEAKEADGEIERAPRPDAAREDESEQSENPRGRSSLPVWML